MRRPVAFIFGAMALLAGYQAAADNHVTLRMQYYREPSTRVVQPVIEIEKDLPGGFDVNTHVLLDAITSASAASGPSGDNIFTEVRDEAAIRIGKNWSRARVTLAYSYSAESDYWSHIVAGGAAFRVWGDTGTLSLSGGVGYDDVGKRVLGAAPTPVMTGPCVPNGVRHCPLDQQFAGISYSQVLSPTFVVQGGYELALLNGYLASPYRSVPQQQGGEVVPDKRWRNAVAARVAYYIPPAGLGLQLHLRYYWDLYYKLDGIVPAPASDPLSTTGGDPWKVRSFTAEGRVYKTLGRDVEVRATYRFYSQGSAAFWCDQALGTSCYTNAMLYTTDPKLTPVSTQYLEGKIYWDAARWRGTPFAGWFSAGTFELSYGYYWQNTTYAGAHVLQAGYTIPY